MIKRGYASTNESGDFNLFGIEGEWIGYMLDNSAGNLNVFSEDGQWLGFTT